MPEESKSLLGKTCLITGANSGLGKALSVEMARRGASVIMACRKNYIAVRDEIRTLSGNENVTLRMVDLSSLESVTDFCNLLRDEKVQVDIIFINAGITASASAISSDGFPLLWQVNFLSYALLVRRLLNDGLIPNSVFTNNGNCPDQPARIIITSSSRHRGPFSIDLEKFGTVEKMRFRDTLKWYGWSKLYLMTYVWGLGHRLSKKGKVDVAVHAFCPGPFRSGIGRGAGAVVQLAMRLMPTSPEKAAWPAIQLATKSEFDDTTLRYFHKRKLEDPDPRVEDPVVQTRLWEKTENLLSPNLNQSEVK